MGVQGSHFCMGQPAWFCGLHHPFICNYFPTKVGPISAVFYSKFKLKMGVQRIPTRIEDFRALSSYPILAQTCWLRRKISLKEKIVIHKGVQREKLGLEKTIKRGWGRAKHGGSLSLAHTTLSHLLHV